MYDIDAAIARLEELRKELGPQAEVKAFDSSSEHEFAIKGITQLEGKVWVEF